jgi:cytochrome c6
VVHASYARKGALCLVPVVLVALTALAAEAKDDVDQGREIFVEVAQPQCGLCHTLADAEASGAIGPSLDALQPTKSRVQEAVRTGPGVMPSYGESLSNEQIEALGAYVSSVAGQR